MRWLGSCAIVVVLAAACTRLNPGFEDGSAATGDEQGEEGQEGQEGQEGEGPTSGGTTRGSADTSDTRATTAEGTTRGATTDPDDTSAMDTSLVTEGPLDTGFACTLEFPDVYPLVSDPPFQELFGHPCPALEMLVIGEPGANGGEVSGLLCNDQCDCEPAIPITLDFGSVPLPPLPECIVVGFRHDPVTCEVLDYTITQHLALAPLFTASNRSLVAGGLTFLPPMESTEECPELCPPPITGHYLLVQANTLEEVPPDGTPVELMAGLESYMVVNDRSGIDLDCNDVVRWHATQVR